MCGMFYISQRLKSLPACAAWFDIGSYRAESIIGSCLNNAGLLLVTVNAEGASEVVNVSVMPFHY